MTGDTKDNEAGFVVCSETPLGTSRFPPPKKSRGAFTPRLRVTSSPVRVQQTPSITAAAFSRLIRQFLINRNLIDIRQIIPNRPEHDRIRRRVVERHRHVLVRPRVEGSRRREADALHHAVHDQLAHARRRVPQCVPDP